VGIVPLLKGKIDMNINDLKARLSTLNRKTQKQNDIWKPKDEHDVRLLPAPKGEDPFVERAFHWNIGDAVSILCPKVNFGEECAICDYADFMKSWKDEKGNDKPEKIRKADFEVFKKVQAQNKVFVRVVERTAEGISEPKWWGLTQNQATQILDVCTDADRLQACDLDPGDPEKALDAVFSTKKAFDLHVSFAKPGEKGNTKSFTSITIKPKFKVSALTGDAKKDAAILEGIKPISEVYPRIPSNEVELALKKFIAGGGDEAKPEPKDGEEKYPTNSKEDAKKVGKRSVEDAFSELAGS
jgi:hypothetical protein